MKVVAVRQQQKDYVFQTLNFFSRFLAGRFGPGTHNGGLFRGTHSPTTTLGAPKNRLSLHCVRGMKVAAIEGEKGFSYWFGQ